MDFSAVETPEDLLRIVNGGDRHPASQLGALLLDLAGLAKPLSASALPALTLCRLENRYGERTMAARDALAVAANWELLALRATDPAERAAFVAVAEASYTGISPTWRTRRRLWRRRCAYYRLLAERAEQTLAPGCAKAFRQLSLDCALRSFGFPLPAAAK